MILIDYLDVIPSRRCFTKATLDRPIDVAIPFLKCKSKFFFHDTQFMGNVFSTLFSCEYRQLTNRTGGGERCFCQIHLHESYMSEVYKSVSEENGGG